MKIYCLFGPNLNMLNFRDNNHYGDLNFKTLCSKITTHGTNFGFDVICFQTNFEGELIEYIHQIVKNDENCCILANLGAWTHYSYAILDALDMIKKQNLIIEVHLSDIENRENFRKVSVIKNICIKRFYGKKIISYYDAIEYIYNLRKN